MELVSIGTKLMVSTTKTGTYKELYGFKSTPAMGGEAEKIDVSNHGHIFKKYIRGQKDLGDLDFGFYYNSSEENPSVTEDQIAASYSTLRGYDKANSVVYWKLLYPDGTGFSWAGTVTVTRDAADVNAALAFTAKVLPQTDLEDIVPVTSSQTTTTTPVGGK